MNFLVGLFRRRPKTVITAATFFALWLFGAWLGQHEKTELEALRASEPHVYLERVFEAGDYDRYVNEAKELVPDWYAENQTFVQDKINLAERSRRGAICIEKKLDAVVMSREFVKDALLAPSTAQFPSSRDATVKYGYCDFSVRSHVEAENRFGVPIRHRYKVNMDYDPDRDIWTRTHIEVEETR